MNIRMMKLMVTLNAPNTSDIHRLHEDDREQNQATDAKVIRRVTLKIDFYFIPIIGTLCVFFLPPISFLPLIVRLSYRSLRILGECTAAAPLGASPITKSLQDRSYVSLSHPSVFLTRPKRNIGNA